MLNFQSGKSETSSTSFSVNSSSFHDKQHAYLDSAPGGEWGEHGDASTEHRPSTLQGEAIRDLDDEPDNHYDDDS